MPEQVKRERWMLWIAFFAAALPSLSFPASAITVELAADRNGTFVDENITQITILENESVKFQIRVYEGTKTSSGAFSIYESVAEKTYKLVGKPHFAFAACACKGSRDMPDLNEEYTFIPLRPGKYRAEALYGGVSRIMDITVAETMVPPSTTTTSSLKSAPSSGAATSTTEQPTITSTTVPLETLPSITLREEMVSSTAPHVIMEKTQSSFPWLPALLGLAAVCAFFYLFTRKKKGCSK